jgi:hypothetical protein
MELRMSDLLQKINARLQLYNRDELMALIWDFLFDRTDECAECLQRRLRRAPGAGQRPGAR